MTTPSSGPECQDGRGTVRTGACWWRAERVWRFGTVAIDGTNRRERFGAGQPGPGWLTAKVAAMLAEASRLTLPKTPATTVIKRRPDAADLADPTGRAARTAAAAGVEALTGRARTEFGRADRSTADRMRGAGPVNR
jgi:hypothetical protein